MHVPCTRAHGSDNATEPLCKLHMARSAGGQQPPRCGQPTRTPSTTNRLHCHTYPTCSLSRRLHTTHSPTLPPHLIKAGTTCVPPSFYICYIICNRVGGHLHERHGQGKASGTGNLASKQRSMSAAIDRYQARQQQSSCCFRANCSARYEANRFSSNGAKAY